jgi:hypothetical protein
MNLAGKRVLILLLLAMMPFTFVLGKPGQPLKMEKLIAQCVKTRCSVSVHSSRPPFWTCIATPAFPAHWPEHNGSLLAAYGYVYAILPEQADCRQEAGPVCQVLIDPSKPDKPKCIDLNFDPKHVETQGVRPVWGREKDVADSYEEVQSMLVAISLGKVPSANELQTIKRYYQYWRSNHKSIADRIARYHPDFFSWLGQSTHKSDSINSD